MFLLLQRVVENRFVPFISVLMLVSLGTLWFQFQECDAEEYRILQFTLAIDAPAYRAMVREKALSEKLSQWDYSSLLRAYWRNSGNQTFANPPLLNDVEAERKSFHAAVAAVK